MGAEIDSSWRWRCRRLAVCLLVLLPIVVAARSPAAESLLNHDRWYAEEPPSLLTHGPFLGAASDTGIKVWARARERAGFQVEIKRAGELWPGTVLGGTQLDGETDFTGVVEIRGLERGTGYEYRPLLNGRAAMGGTFRTMPPAGQPGTFRFVLGGDLDERFAPFAVLDRLREQGPTFGVLLGDLIYSDSPLAIPATAEAYRAKYRTNWSDRSFRLLTRDVPFFTMWDDHEIVNDYDGAEPERYRAARTALEEYVASANPAPLRGDDLYYSFRVADVDFFVLDARSHRHRNALPDGNGKTMLGPEQKALLKGWLADSRAPFKVVLSSVPFHDLGTPRPDAWTGFAAERRELLEYIRERDISGVVILSGDQHWSSLIRHYPYGVWEFNATPLAQAIHAQPVVNDPRLVLAYGSSPAFGIVDVDTRGGRPRMTFSVLDDRGRLRGSHTIGVDAPRAGPRGG